MKNIPLGILLGSFILFTACDVGTSASKPDEKQDDKPSQGKLVFDNKFTREFSFQTLLTSLDFDSTATPATWLSEPVAPGNSKSFFPQPLNTDLHARLFDSGENKYWNFIQDENPAILHFDEKRSYLVTVSADTLDVTNPVWAWQLEAHPAYEVADLHASATDSAITLSWSDPDMSDISEVLVYTVNAGKLATKLATVSPGVENYTITGLASETAFSYGIVIAYPEIASNGISVSMTTLAQGVIPVLPSVLSVLPTDGSIDVDVASPVISVTFSESMTASSVTASTVTLTGPGNSAVNAAVTYTYKKATLVPSAPLSYETEYTVNVSGSVKSLNGVALGQDRTWKFTTAKKPLFSPAVFLDFGSYPDGMASGNINGDAYPDLIVSSGRYSDPGMRNDLFLYKGRSDGAFDGPVQLETSVIWDIRHVVIGDLDSDGDMDVAAVRQTSGLEIYRNDGTGILTAEASLALQCLGSYLSIGDMNGDGRNDLVTFGYATPTSSSTILAVYYQQADHTFLLSPSVEKPLINTTYEADLRLADLNGDGRTDISVFSKNNFIRFFQQADGSLTESPIVYDVDGSQFTLGDTNGDDVDDLVFVDRNNSTKIHVAVASSPGAFSTAYETYTVGVFVNSPLIGDMDKDGFKDIILCHHHEKKIGILRGKGDGTFTAEEFFSFRSNQYWDDNRMLVLDINADGELDVIVQDDYGVSIFK